jgi:class 3 adenylate cyclase
MRARATAETGPRRAVPTARAEGRLRVGLSRLSDGSGRLAAILAADVVGYSRLMGQDEAGTLARLKTLRRELIDPKIAEHKGRIVKTTGDGILIEFPSVVEAVACAVAVQRGMARWTRSVLSASSQKGDPILVCSPAGE